MISLIYRHLLKSTAVTCLALTIGCGGGSGSSSGQGSVATPSQPQQPSQPSQPEQPEQPGEENTFTACNIQIETPVEGGVTTTSTAIECAPSKTCGVDVSDIYFDETFVAQPVPGWHFASWEERQAGLCGGDTTSCTINSSDSEGNSCQEGVLIDSTVTTYLEPQFIVNRTTGGIALAGEQNVTQFGVDLDFDFYRNSAYECGLSGNYTFMVLNPANGDADDEAPLWVYLHGGGLGYYDENGDYLALTFQDENTFNHEETFQDLQDHLTSRVLDEQGQPDNNTLTRRIQEGYRLLLVSLCDHDNYSGLGTPYPNNPLPNREVNGMQASMSAVEYTVANYPTTEVWAHGTSAGSSGVYHLAVSFAAEDINLTGVVADHIVGSPRSFETMPPYFGQEGSPVDGDLDIAAYGEKVGFYFDLDNGAYPEARVAAGFDDVPIFFMGGRNDPFCHANFPAVPSAAALGRNNCEYVYDGIAQVVAAQTDSRHQVSVFDGGHVPSINRQDASNAVDAFIDNILADNPGAPFRAVPGQKMMLMGHSFFRPFADEMPYHALRSGVDGHSQNVEFSGGASGAPLALWNDAGHRARIQAVLDAGDVDVFGMTCCDLEFTTEGDPILITEGYQLWFDYALAQNPDTAFFIGMPWIDFPTDYADAGAYADLWHLFYNTIILPAVDELRALYPGVTIYSIPYGAAAIELRLMFEAGNLPDVSSLQGASDSALFTDYKGHAGQILRDLGEYIWMDAIYGVNLDKYAYDDGYQTDLKALAKSIMDAHNPDYNGPNR
jgi:hypothetical protein